MVEKILSNIWQAILMNSKLIVEFYAALKRKIYHQYCDTFDMEWPK